MTTNQHRTRITTNTPIKLSQGYLEELDEMLSDLGSVDYSAEELQIELNKINDAISVAPFDRELLPLALEVANDLQTEINNRL